MGCDGFLFLKYNKQKKSGGSLVENRQEDEKQETYHEVKAISPIKVVLITLGIVILLVAALVGGGVYYVYSQLNPVDPDSNAILEVEIPMGSSAVRIAQILEEKGIIKNSKLFYYYVRFKDETGFQAGTYQLSPSDTIDEIIAKLKEGTAKESVRFTIPEGLTVEETALRLEEQGVADAERFLQVVNEGDFSDFAFIDEIPEDVPGRKYRLEGFLYPETYEVYKGASEEEIIRKLLSQFEKEFKEEWYPALEEHDLTVYEAVTLASIIEREAVLEEERKTISGVFHNRLDADWRLESCATVLYVLGIPKERLTLEDLEVESPFNTYTNDGLPPAPIANPRAASIEAALFPEEHDYFFFVVRNDGSNGHYFSETYEEHLKHDAKSRGNF
jgi:UPF0755 protein